MQLAKASLKNILFRLLSLLAVLIAVFIAFELTLSLIVSYTEWKWVITLMNFLGQLYQDEDRALSNILFSFFYFAAMIGLGLLVKREWLPAACLLVISLPLIIIQYFTFSNQNWSIPSLMAFLPQQPGSLSPGG